MIKQERLQKVIAASGRYSRRQAEELMKQGKVIVDGKKITQLGTKVNPQESHIVVCGRLISNRAQKKYFLFHKPRQCMVTRDDPEGRKTIYDYLPQKMRNLKPVGRLDYDSEGLLLLTNDGEFAQKLTHPQFHIEKIYEVKVVSKPNARQLERLRAGFELDGRKTLPMKVDIIDENPKSTWLSMVLYEGRNRQIRRMCDKVGLTVKTLVRTQFGAYTLKGIPYAKYKEVSLNLTALASRFIPRIRYEKAV